MLAFALGIFSVLAQAPEKMSYQTVVRNSSGVLVANSAVGLRISLLQGTSTGTAVYVETHSVTTNANGLASLAIGGGTVVSGSMASIDWAAGPYFVKTEVDPNGGTSYTISGTSQLMSVPYALFAAHAPTTIGNVAPGDTLGDMMYWNGSGWVILPAGKDGEKLTMCDGTPKWTKNGNCSPFYIGRHYGGGVIFYIDSTGEHGLIAATQNSGIHPWGCRDVVVGASGFVIGTGQANTDAIETGCTTPNTAADVCANLSLNGYDDWYLPSIGELYQLFLNQTAVGGFPADNGHYWSSTEFSASRGYDIIFNTPWDSTHDTAKNEEGYVRPIRSF